MATSLTDSFRELCAQSASSLSQPAPTQRKRKSRSNRTAQPTASTSSSSSPPSSSPSPSPQDQDDDSDPFLSEAYKIHHHISALLVQLQSIRRQYLSISSPAPPGAKGKAKERGFTEKERDEVDLQAKILLKRCLERVLALEREEEEGGGGKGRKNKAPTQPPTSQRLLSLLLPPTLTSSLHLPFTTSFSSSSQATLLLKAHHASILFHLHRSLSHAGSVFSSLQEERIRRSTEASNRTLGAGLGSLLSSSGTGAASGTNRWGVGGAGSGRTLVVPKAPVWKPELDEDGNREGGLSEGDVQMFEKENSELLRGYDEHLDQITKTTQTLTQISTLQSLLSQSLLTQSETSSRLLLEAGQGVSDVRAGNKQLEKAKERGGSGRLMVLVFLIGAGVALLFLDWMS
ncbi:hypothetical protein BDY24DRAFT_68802 [Mrakia frigida]|uniref:Ufe1p n=1 Tax=Mrakia frigida TaxID=29902 RepID=UPI003FCC2231